MDDLFCTDCEQRLKEEEKECPVCGSKNRTRKILITDRIGFNESIRGKVKSKESKRPIEEFKIGDDYNRDRKKYVDRTMIIDRKNDKYIESIKDKETGETIHECNESLKEHYGHGNAKKEKNK